ncbi:MAG: DUF692 domain-containing protein [Pseudomonadales bacterium]|nr:DUF692 domain-containing protein [Pseudomonadales bacterium]
MKTALAGAGLGLRRELFHSLKTSDLADIDFFEIAPENWLDLGGRYARDLRFFSERKPIVCHGLSLSLGGTLELDVELLKKIKTLLRTHNMPLYTEHLSWCTDQGHLYDLLPIPCSMEAVQWVAQRIRQAQDILEMQIGIENASYYFNPPGAEMREEEFIAAVVAEADCLLHLDVNNLYVNSQNFGFDPRAYLQSLPLERVCYLHVAGHYVEADGMIVDTHGSAVIDPVWALLEHTYQQIEQRSPQRSRVQLPTCLERDFNIPPLATLLSEVEQIRELQHHHNQHGIHQPGNTDSCMARQNAESSKACA